MRKRRVVCLVAGLFLAVPIFLFGDMVLSPGPGISPQNFHRLYVGMTDQEVETILGGPGSLDEGLYVTGASGATWRGEYCTIRVLFKCSFERDGNGEVLFNEKNQPVSKDVACMGELEMPNGIKLGLRQQKESFQEKLRRWLHW